MSLVRLVYYSALIGGWAALAGWMLAEILFFRHGGSIGRLGVAAIGAIVGGAIGAGLGLVASIANGQRLHFARRSAPGLLGGALGGGLGSLLGDFLYAHDLPRALGWMVMGLAIGLSDGIYERSASKLRNGLIGGGLGGLLGGSLFDPIQRWIEHGSGMSSRATAFVILGIAIGVMIGLVQVVLKEAWLTVLDGYRAGRQLILSQPVAALGRGDHLALPFLGPLNRDLESEHVKLTRQPSGAYVVEDNRTRLGTRLNNQPLLGPTVLKDGDVIKLGSNFVRFNERRRRQGEEPMVPAPAFQVKPAPPPPPIRKPAVAPEGASPPSPPPLPPVSPPRPAPGVVRPGAIPPPPPPHKPKS